MNIPTLLLGRILLAVPFLVFGVMHFPGAAQMSGMVPSWIPGGVLWVYVTGAAQIAAGIAFITGKQARLAGLLTALMLFIFVVTIHVPGLSNPAMSQMAFMSILKDLGLAGGALLICHLAESK
jgi:uncharacterized membrane protein YphA (DoxX/SURF4 family)